MFYLLTKMAHCLFKELCFQREGCIIKLLLALSITLSVERRELSSYRLAQHLHLSCTSDSGKRQNGYPVTVLPEYRVRSRHALAVVISPSAKSRKGFVLQRMSSPTWSGPSQGPGFQALARLYKQLPQRHPADRPSAFPIPQRLSRLAPQFPACVIIPPSMSEEWPAFCTGGIL